MNEINKTGLTIIPYGNDVPINELNMLSVYRLKKQLSEDEYYDQLFNMLLNQKTNIFSKTTIKDGELGSIAF